MPAYSANNTQAEPHVSGPSRPLGAPASDCYGADRAGDGLHGNSLVALDARTGETTWYLQLVHYDLWDYDLAAPPALFDIHRKGRVIPAVAEITTMGPLFVFDRVTGEPVFGIEERPVPQTTIPGEVTAKTQPFPVKPRRSRRIHSIWRRSTTGRASTRNSARSCSRPTRWKSDRLHPPPVKKCAVLPEHSGRRQLAGVSIDPSLGLLFDEVMNVRQWGPLANRRSGVERSRAEDICVVYCGKRDSSEKNDHGRLR